MATPADDAASSTRDSAQPKPQIRKGKMISVVLAGTLLICASFSMVYRQKFPRVRTGEITGSSLVAGRENPLTPQNVSQQADSASRDPIASGFQSESIVEIKDDPAELWKRVQAGSADAEVELAKLYVDGNGVAQNCEQARVLLAAAAKKQSGAATRLLSGDYVRRCR
jgi:TPR repeat protein